MEPDPCLRMCALVDGRQMGDDDDYRPRPVAPSATGTPGPFTPRSEREGFLEEQHANGRRGRGGHFEGLDDPESFAR